MYRTFLYTAAAAATIFTAQNISTPALADPSAPLGGPAVAGVCLLSRPAIFDNAKVGVAATARLRQLAQDAQQPLTAEREALEADAGRLDAQRASLSATELKTRQDDLTARAQAYKTKLQNISRQIEATRVKVLDRIAQAAQPVLAQAYQAHGCGLLLSRDAVLGGNMAGDLTPAVVQGLDVRMTTITFDLEPVPPATAAGSAAAE